MESSTNNLRVPDYNGNPIQMPEPKHGPSDHHSWISLYDLNETSHVITMGHPTLQWDTHLMTVGHPIPPWDIPCL